jgi:hypothetical protein
MSGVLFGNFLQVKMHNLIEDEKTAQTERRGIRLGTVLIIAGVIFLWLNLKKE